MPSIPLSKVSPKSELAHSIGYDAVTRTLAVKHHDGSVYHYSGVPDHKWRGLQNAKSKGSYIHDQIRGKHPFKSVGANRPPHCHATGIVDQTIDVVGVVGHFTRCSTYAIQ